MKTETPYSISTLKTELDDQIKTVTFLTRSIERNPYMRIDYKIELEQSIQISNGYINDLKMAIETLS